MDIKERRKLGCELGYASPNAKDFLRKWYYWSRNFTFCAMIMSYICYVLPTLYWFPCLEFVIFVSIHILFTHNLFLHLALMLSRKIPRSVSSIKVKFCLL
uniref:Uncharacterized protein n=1 Tax=Citrus limon TaxID=2708 RepID=A0A1S8AD48_CITLI